ncbi:MAG: MGMT family protein [Candidatus Paceibacterota bacterium]
MTFKEKVFSIVKKIEKGKVMTYKEVAEKIGHPKSYRAVGNVLNKNTDKNIPCHRVIRSDKKIGGYNKGTLIKKRLLQKEGFNLT